MLEPSHIGNFPGDLAPSYPSLHPPLETPTITIVETASFNKKQTTPKRIDIPVMRVQAQQHRTKFLMKTPHSTNQSPGVLSPTRTTGPLIKVVSGRQNKKLNGTPLHEENTEEEEDDLREFE